LTDIRQHFLQNRRHLGQVAGILRIQVATRGLRAGGKAQQQIADAL